jgi:thymidine kinase
MRATRRTIHRWVDGTDFNRLRIEDFMSLQAIKDAIANKKMICPKCKGSIQQFDKYANTIDAVRDGFNVLEIDSRGERVTLICGNEGCSWKERTEYPMEFVED